MLFYSQWIYGACRGIDNEPVVARELAMSIGCSKNFLGSEQLDTKSKVRAAVNFS